MISPDYLLMPPVWVSFSSRAYARSPDSTPIIMNPLVSSPDVVSPHPTAATHTGRGCRLTTSGYETKYRLRNLVEQLPLEFAHDIMSSKAENTRTSKYLSSSSTWVRYMLPVTGLRTTGRECQGSRVLELLRIST